MNKTDFKLILFILIIFIIFATILNITKKKGNLAYVYYMDDVILKIDLNIDNKYSVNGENGIVKIEVKDKKIRVIEEESPLHLCSKQGYISNSYESIICLPNKIVIKIIDEVKLDGVVG